MKSFARIALGASFALFATVTASPAHAITNVVASGSWYQGDNGQTPLANSSAAFCYLTRVAGNFRGGAEWVNVSVVGTEWYVGGGSEELGVMASANCVPYSAFSVEPKTGVVGWSSTWWEYTGGGSSGKPASISTTTWNGDSALMLTGMNGEFDGGAEYVWANQAGGATAVDLFQSEADSAGGVAGWARSFFAGVPSSGYNPVFYGPGGSATTANTAGVYRATAERIYYPSVSTVMAPTSEAFCYFTRIGGAFNGGGESVGITTTMVNGVEHWELTATSGQITTFAEARCYAYNQDPIFGFGFGVL